MAESAKHAEMSMPRATPASRVERRAHKPCRHRCRAKRALHTRMHNDCPSQGLYVYYPYGHPYGEFLPKFDAPRNRGQRPRSMSPCSVHNISSESGEEQPSNAADHAPPARARRRAHISTTSEHAEQDDVPHSQVSGGAQRQECPGLKVVFPHILFISCACSTMLCLGNSVFYFWQKTINIVVPARLHNAVLLTRGRVPESAKTTRQGRARELPTVPHVEETLFLPGARKPGSCWRVY